MEPVLQRVLPVCVHLAARDEALACYAASCHWQCGQNGRRCVLVYQAFARISTRVTPVKRELHAVLYVNCMRCTKVNFACHTNEAAHHRHKCSAHRPGQSRICSNERHPAQAAYHNRTSHKQLPCTNHYRCGTTQPHTTLQLITTQAGPYLTNMVNAAHSTITSDARRQAPESFVTAQQPQVRNVMLPRAHNKRLLAVGAPDRRGHRCTCRAKVVLHDGRGAAG